MKLFPMAREALIAVLVYDPLKTTMLKNILKWINLWTRLLPIYRIKPESSQQFGYLFKCGGLKLIACWDLKDYHIIIIKINKGKISIEFPESVNLEKSYFR